MITRNACGFAWPSAVLALVLTVGVWTPIAAQQGATDSQWR